MDPDDARIRRAYELWGRLDEAMLASGLDESLADRPWESSHPGVLAAWESLTRPENLTDLEFWSEWFENSDRGMTEYARKMTLKAIEVCRTKGAAGRRGAADRP